MGSNSPKMYRRVALSDTGAAKNGPDWTTQRIVMSPVGRSLYYLENDQLVDKAVSSFSLWHDHGWTFDTETAGMERTGINWHIKLEDGSYLTDSNNADVLNWSRRFVWSLLVAPGDGASALSVSSIDSLSVGFKTLITWMIANQYRTPAELTPDAVSEFCDDLPELLSDTGEVSESQVWLPIRTVSQLWKQRRALTKAGCEAMAKHPFNGETANEVQLRIATRGRGWILPLPDEVAIPLLNRAHWFVEVASNDILELVHQMYEAYFQEPGTHKNGGGISRHVSAKRAKTASLKFRFLDRSAEAWWRGRFEERDFTSEEIRSLFVDLAGASIAILQGGTGVRISEIAAIFAGLDEESGLPSAVEKRISASGLFEMFYLRSHIAKGEESPRKVEWLMGMRLVGTEILPPVVTALIIAQKLFDPVRWLAGTERMFVSLPPGSGLPKSEAGVGPIYSGHLRDWLRGFIERWVDLNEIPDQSSRPYILNDLVEYKVSKGRCVKPTQFRKTFASFAIHVSSGLIPALAMHFKHMSHAMTEQGYIGSNPILLADRDSIAAQRTASIFFDLVGGNTAVAGKRGAHLLENLEEARKLLLGNTVAATWKNSVELVQKIGVTAWFQIDGACLPFDSENMLCHKDAGTRPNAINIQPNHEFRRPSTCGGCDNYLITAQNRSFWLKRYIENKVAAREHGSLESILSGAVFEKRAAVAGAWLRMLGEDMKDIDAI